MEPGRHYTGEWPCRSDDVSCMATGRVELDRILYWNSKEFFTPGGPQQYVVDSSPSPWPRNIAISVQLSGLGSIRYIGSVRLTSLTECYDLPFYTDIQIVKQKLTNKLRDMQEFLQGLRYKMTIRCGVAGGCDLVYLDEIFTELYNEHSMANGVPWFQCKFIRKF